MKMMLEVDLTGYTESDIGEVIKNRIFNEAIKQAEDNILKKIREVADNRLSQKIDTIIDKAINNFTKREIVLTDQYGDVQHRYENVDEMLKDRFDNFLDERVDKSTGKAAKDRCSYGNSVSRIEYILDKRIDLKANKITNEIVGKVERITAEKLNEAMKKRVTDYLITKLDISKAITNVVEAKSYNE